MQLTIEQLQAIRQGQPVELQIDGTLCILLKKEVYQEQIDWDDSDWSQEEMNFLADEVDAIITAGEEDATEL